MEFDHIFPGPDSDPSAAAVQPRGPRLAGTRSDRYVRPTNKRAVLVAVSAGVVFMRGSGADDASRCIRLMLHVLRRIDVVPA